MRSFWPLKKGVIFVVLSIIIIAIPITGFLLSKNISNISIKSSLPIQEPIVSCSSYSTDLGEISCSEAKTIAIKKYPGEITGIGKLTLQNRKAWLIQVNASSSSGSARIAIDRETKEIFLFSSR